MECIGQINYLLAVGFGFLHTCSSFPVDPRETDVATFSGLSQSWLGIISLSILFLVASVVLLAGCLCCRGNNGFKAEDEVVKEEVKEFRNSVSTTNISGVGIGFTNSNLSPNHGGNELAIFPPPGVNTTSVTFEPLPNIVPPLQLQQQQQIARSKPPLFNTSPSQDFSIADWFVKEANFPRDQLHYLRECGKGWFGRVVEGEARGVKEGNRSSKVVVRILREDATPSEQKFFLNEVKPFRDLSHPNILNLVGRCLDTEPFLLLLESCSSGDLKSFLCGNVASRSALCEQGICLRMMCDVASGLQHMHENGFVHTDLAARNCLVTSDLTVKVGDYGTSIETYKDDYYIAGDMAIPIRWCSPESLHCTDTTIETKQMEFDVNLIGYVCKKVTASANVWSFGVLLWEVCEFGALPYTSLSDEQVIVRVLGKEGLKLPPPTYPSLHAAHLYSLMQMCWREDEQRATLDHVIAMLRHLQVSRTLDSEDNFERRWETLKPNTIPVTDNQKLDVVTLKSDFDSGVDLDAKSADFDISKRKSSDISPATTSPQLSVTSSSGGDFFTPSATLKRQLSPSLTNLRGSFEDIPVQIVSSPEQSPQHAHLSNETEQFDSWLKGVETTNEEDVKFVKKISEAIRDLDDALALEKSSSSSEGSSKQGSPIKELNISDQNPTLDFRLGLISSNIQQLDSLQDDNSGIRQDSSSDTEEETWRGRVERGEFSEKVKEKSRSVADLMVLTHIENSDGSDESDSLPSLTRQYSIEKSRKYGYNRPSALQTTMTAIGFGSEGNIRGAILGEEFQESLKQLQTAWKIRDAESRNTSLTFEDINRIPSQQTQTKNESNEINFLGDVASEKETDKNECKTVLVSNSNVNNSNNLTSHLSKEHIEKQSLNDKDIKEDLCENVHSSVSETGATNKDANISTNVLPDLPNKTNDNINLENEIIIKAVNVCNENLSKVEESMTKSAPEDYDRNDKESIADTVRFLENESLHTGSLLVENIQEINSDVKNCDISLNDLDENLDDSSKSVDDLSPSNKEITIDESITDKDNLNAELNNISVQDFLIDSKETSLSELESSSQSSEQVTTVVENDLLIKSDDIGEVNYQTDTLKNIPQIVVTEANELEMDNFDTESENLCTNVEYKPRKFRIVISQDTDSDTDDEASIDSIDVFENIEPIKLENDLTADNKSRTKRSINENEGSFLEEIEVSDIDLEKSFSSNSSSVNVYNNKDNNCDSKIKFSNSDMKNQNDIACNVNTSNVNNNNADHNQYSVILGSCEDYTLDYFKGLKTTNGKPLISNDADYSSKNQNDNVEENDVEKDDNINNWDRFLTDSLRERTLNEDTFRTVHFDQRGLDSLSSSQTDMTSDDTVIEDQNEDEISERLNKINLDFSERNGSDSNHLDNCIINSDYNDDKDSVYISDRNFNIYDEYSNQNKDVQMNEVKTRLENVAKFSEGFKLKSENTNDDEEDEGKLLTPDDERSSDSGFRDKGSLSESVEDACDEKYNLEDIEAELEEAYTKKDSKYFSLQDEMSSSSGEFCAQSNFPSSSYNLQCSNDTLMDLDETKDDNENSTNKLMNGLNSELEEEVECLSTFNESQEPKSTGWFLHPQSEASSESQPSSGWYPSPVAQDSNRDDTSYVSFHLDEEFVTAIRNELKEKLPCAQQQSNTKKEGEEDSVSPEEERADMVIEYSSFGIPLSPILEERESVSSNQSSLILDLPGSNFTSGRSSPVLLLERRNSIDERTKNFEDEIKLALNLCKTDSLESDDNAMIVEDLEEEKQTKVKERHQDDFDDLLIIDTETNEAKLLESPRPKSHLAFVHSQKVNEKIIDDVPETSPSINTDTYTPDSISPVSSRSSRTGVALSFSSTDTGNLSNFLSPSSLRSEFVDSGPPSLPFDLGEAVDEVEKISIGPSNIAADIIEDLHELGVIKDDCDTDRIDCITPVNKLEPISQESLNNQPNMNESVKQLVDDEILDSLKRDLEIDLPKYADFSNNDKLSPNFTLDDLLITKQKESYDKNSPNGVDLLENTKKIDESDDWLKSVLLPLTRVSSDLIIDKPKDIEHCLPVTILPKESWPSSDELIPESVIQTVDTKQQIQEQDEPKKTVENNDSSNQESDKKCKTLDLNSTLALSSPNFPFGPDSNSSMVSSFSSTPTFDTTKSLADIQMSLSISSNDGEDTIKIVPSLRFLASEVLRLNKKVLIPLPPVPSPSTLDAIHQSKRMNNLTLALDTSEVQSKAPMPSPEDADKGTWRPTISQLLDLTNQNDHDIDADDLMTTSFIERDCDGDRYTPDWESDISDAESDDHSSSSGEFIWKDGDREESIKAKMATASYEEPQEDVSDKGMERIDEEDEDDEDDDDELGDDSSCASATEFIPSTWDHGATPTKSALRTTDKKQDSLRRVCFKKQKYHCVYEYPREPSESEDDDIESPTRRTWQTVTEPSNYDCFADWELGECEIDTEAVDTDPEESTQYRNKNKTGRNNSQHSGVDIYRLSGFDYDLAQMSTDDGEFFISSSARPFHQLGSSSEFFPGKLQNSLDNQAQPKDEPREFKVTSVNENFIENERKNTDENELGVGGLRHTRESLKLDLPNPAGECTSPAAPTDITSNSTPESVSATTTANTVTSPATLTSNPVTDNSTTNVNSNEKSE